MAVITDSIPNKEFYFKSNVTILFSIFANLVTGCIYSNEETKLQVQSTLFEENSNLEKGACFHVQKSKGVLIDKCFAKSCQTNYNGDDSLFIVGQFGNFLFLKVSDVHFYVTNCAFTSCAPDYDPFGKRISTIETNCQSSHFSGLNFSYNNLKSQVLFYNSIEMKFSTFKRNTVGWIFQNDLRGIHTHHSVQYIGNNITSSNPIFLATAGKTEMTNCVFQNNQDYLFDIKQGATIKIFESWFDLDIPKQDGITIENNITGSQPTYLTHLEVRLLHQEMRNLRRIGMWPKPKLIMYSIFSLLAKQF